MFAPERRQRILELLQSESRVTVTQLTEALQVSEATVRRDLQELEQNGLLIRTHGGAMLDSSSGLELSFAEKEVTSLDEKKYIAKLAASFIKEGDTIILDAGTTTLEMVPYITQKNLTIVTNSLMAAVGLSQNPEIELIIVGGQNRYKTKAITGFLAQQTLQMFQADKVFLGVNGVHLQHGITTPTVEEAMLKKQMIKSAKELFVLADSSKLQKVTFTKIEDLSNIDWILTDPNVKARVLEQYRKENIHITYEEKG